jgi:hypothetical protein
VKCTSEILKTCSNSPKRYQNTIMLHENDQIINMAHSNFTEFLSLALNGKPNLCNVQSFYTKLLLLLSLGPWSHASSSCNIPCLWWSICTKLCSEKRLITRWIESRSGVLWYLTWELRNGIAPCLSWSKLVPYLQQLCSTSAINLMSMYFLNNLIIIGEEPSLNPVTRWSKMNIKVSVLLKTGGGN